MKNRTFPLTPQAPAKRLLGKKRFNHAIKIIDWINRDCTNKSTWILFYLKKITWGRFMDDFRTALINKDKPIDFTFASPVHA